MQEEEQSQHDPASDEDQIEIAGYDGLEWFQNSIVVVDTKGKPERRIIGEMLDPSDTTILSVGVNDLKMAEEIFLPWVAPGKDVNKVNDGYDYSLTDYDGSTQGSVAFRIIQLERKLSLCTFHQRRMKEVPMVSQRNI